jgi:thymidine phosphorylase
MPTSTRVPIDTHPDNTSFAAIDLLCKVGPHGAGEARYSNYANSETGLEFARNLAAESSGYEVTP